VPEHGPSVFADVPKAVWQASIAACVILAGLVLVWMRSGRSPDAQAEQDVVGRYRADTAEAGCVLEEGDLAEVPFFVLREGPLQSVVLHGCADDPTCTLVAQRHSLGIGPPPIPLSLLLETCDECPQPGAEVDWQNAMVFPVALERALGEDSETYVYDLHVVRSLRASCVALRYRTWFERTDEGWTLRRQVDHARRNEVCADDAETWASTLEQCADARRWTLSRVR
jgi:hypothetical protein